MKKINFVLYAALAFVSLFSVASCQKDQVPENSDQEGFIQLQINDPDVDIITKAATVISDDYQVVVSQGEEIVKAATYGELKAPFALIPGDYSIYAQNINSEKALEERGLQHFYGTLDKFSITAGVTTNVSFQCAMINSRVSVNFEDKFRTVYKDATVKIYESSDIYKKRVIDFPYASTTEDESTWAYFNVDENPEITVVLSVVRNDDVMNTITNTVKIEPKSWHKINFNVSSTAGQAGVLITVNNELIDKDENLNVDPY